VHTRTAVRTAPPAVHLHRGAPLSVPQPTGTTQKNGKKVGVRVNTRIFQKSKHLVVGWRSEISLCHEDRNLENGQHSTPQVQTYRRSWGLG
jgi:hypothetical protein